MTDEKRGEEKAREKIEEGRGKKGISSLGTKISRVVNTLSLLSAQHTDFYAHTIHSTATPPEIQDLLPCCRRGERVTNSCSAPTPGPWKNNWPLGSEA